MMQHAEQTPQPPPHGRVPSPYQDNLNPIHSQNNMNRGSVYSEASTPTSASNSASPRSPTPPTQSSSASVSNMTISNDQLLDHSHLKPGSKASLLSYSQTINMYRENAKKTNNPDIQCDFAVFMVEAAKPIVDNDTARWEYLNEAEKLLKQLAARGHAESQYYLGNLYASALLSRKSKNEFDKAFPLFVQATKHHHPDAAYR
jgi:hypothetical protein